MKRSLCFLCFTMLIGFSAKAHGAEGATDADLLPAEKETSKQRMMQIFDAIQAYRKEHKELPAYLSDLYPQYLSDTNVFICPTAQRRGQGLPFPELLDPKFQVHYGYEFSARPIQAMFGYSGPMTMAAWKRMQMSVAGGVVPILRCFAYDQVLNVSFDGKFYESPLQWENTVLDKVNARDLEPRTLRLALLKRLGEVSGGETLALDELDEAVAGNNRGVIMSDHPLSERDSKWNEEVARAALATADQARKFQETYPQSTNVTQAAHLEQQMLLKAATAGSTDAAQRLKTSLAEKLKKPGLTEDERFMLRLYQVQAVRAGMNARPASETEAAMLSEGRRLIEEFPNLPGPYQMLLAMADGMSGEGARAIAEEIRNSNTAPEEAKDRAQTLLNRLNLVGHAPDIRFTALDGREVDLAKLKGKVVLVDFWATWCGPCVGEIPHVKEAYTKFHDQGFEIVGISFDMEKAALEKFVKARELPWPQYFDGKGWQNQFGERYGIHSIPTMWLVDRNGNVVDTNARNDLAGKVEHLLAAKLAGKS